ncbi:MAG: TlpA family protein disulfide reductase [Chloroflexota bacterium]|nr:TlpA family protein disulfide reductase [Chloroflexota bacterium]
MIDAVAQRPRVPGRIAAVIVAAIAFASVLALLWPSLPFARVQQLSVGPTGVGVITRQVEAPGSAARIGALAPDFEWTAPPGKAVRLSDLRGKPVVINFWATWCVPCKTEMPLLERVARANGGVAFLEVDLNEDGDRIRGFFDQLGLTAIQPLLDVNTETARRYALASVPSTFFIDSAGVIRHLYIGELDGEKLAAGLRKIATE